MVNFDVMSHPIQSLLSVTKTPVILISPLGQESLNLMRGWDESKPNMAQWKTHLIEAFQRLAKEMKLEEEVEKLMK